MIHTIKHQSIQPGTTTVDDVIWAYRILLARDIKDELAAERIRLANRSLLTLHKRLLQSPEINKDKCRQRAANTRLDAPLVRWCYRLLRFEEIDEEEAQQVAAEHETLLALVDALLHAPDYDQIIDNVKPRDASGLAVLYSKSMPRSGHHLLANMLCVYFGAKLNYCEFYEGGPGCCHAIPCRQAFDPLLQNELFLQKSHDFKFDDPSDLPGKYIVQYRHPIPRMQSNFDHNVFVTGYEDSEARFRKFIQGETKYYVRFWTKWMASPLPNFFLVSYEELIGASRETLTRMLHFIRDDDEVDEEALQGALSVMRIPSGSSTKLISEFALRKVKEYRYYDEALYRKIEQEIFERCPGLPLERMFPD